ncbi:MAG: hypothetical protein Q7J85_03695 [Bacillota bacterium]|nr:hypothetical protein [Bacillota bacterium]
MVNKNKKMGQNITVVIKNIKGYRETEVTNIQLPHDILITSLKEN